MYFVSYFALAIALLSTEMRELVGGDESFTAVVFFTSFSVTFSAVFCVLCQSRANDHELVVDVPKDALPNNDQEGNAWCARLPRRLVATAFSAWAFLSEAPERTDLKRCGQRVPYRRLFLWLGFGAYSYLVFSRIHDYATTPVQDQVEDILDTLSPDGFSFSKNGTQLYQGFFDLYNEARWLAVGLLALAWLLLLMSLFCDVMWRNARGLAYSRFLGFIGLVVLFVGAIIPGLPDYLNALHLTEVQSLMMKKKKRKKERERRRRRRRRRREVGKTTGHKQQEQRENPSVVFLFFEPFTDCSPHALSFFFLCLRCLDTAKLPGCAGIQSARSPSHWRHHWAGVRCLFRHQLACHRSGRHAFPSMFRVESGK